MKKFLKTKTQSMSLLNCDIFSELLICGTNKGQVMLYLVYVKARVDKGRGEYLTALCC